MVRILVAFTLLASLTATADADRASYPVVDITNRGCILDIAPRTAHGPVEIYADLALWISPIDVVGPIVKLEVGPVRSVNLCGSALLAGTYGVTAVFGRPAVDYHHPDAIRGTALVTLGEELVAPSKGGSLELPPAEIGSRCRDTATAEELEPPAPSSNRHLWLGASGALLALAALFVRRRGVATYIV